MFLQFLQQMQPFVSPLVNLILCYSCYVIIDNHHKRTWALEAQHDWEIILKLLLKKKSGVSI